MLKFPPCLWFRRLWLYGDKILGLEGTKHLTKGFSPQQIELSVMTVIVGSSESSVRNVRCPYTCLYRNSIHYIGIRVL